MRIPLHIVFLWVLLFSCETILGASSADDALIRNYSPQENQAPDSTDLSDDNDGSGDADLPDSIPTTGDIYVARALVIDGDTMWVADLDEVYIFPTKRFKNRRERRRYTRLIYNVKKAYPWAKMAGEKLEEVEVHMTTLKTEKEQREYIKQVEQELLSDYKEDLKKLTITQGRILIKLVDRETGDTSYELVEELRGKLSAVFWQALARIFGSNLKSEYDAAGDDRLIEEIVILIEAGQL